MRWLQQRRGDQCADRHVHQGHMALVIGWLGVLMGTARSIKQVSDEPSGAV
jgi:hypothetical protein